MPLPIHKELTDGSLVTLDELTASMKSEPTKAAYMARLGPERGQKFLDFLRSQDLNDVRAVFGIKACGQYKADSGRAGRGIDLYDANVFEEALFTAFSFVTHQQRQKEG